MKFTEGSVPLAILFVAVPPEPVKMKFLSASGCEGENPVDQFPLVPDQM